MHAVWNSLPRQSFWIRWGPAILVMVLIFMLSSVPSKEMPSFGNFDLSVKKGGHMLGYALLARSYLWALGGSRSKNWALAWGLAVVYAATDEFHQLFVPGRGAWIVDVGIDGVGALLGLLIARLSAWRR